MKLEGLISKQADAPYRSGRTRSWLKSKCGFEQEFVIIGWRPSDKAGRPFSSLLLAVREGDDVPLRRPRRLRLFGRGGSTELSQQFKALARKTPPVPDVPRDIARHARFVEPKLVAEIAFRGWTREGLVRQGSFKGLRSDKPASRDREGGADATATGDASAETTPARSKVGGREEGRKAHAKTPAKTRARKVRKAVSARVVSSVRDGAEEIAGVRVTHPDRVLYPDCGHHQARRDRSIISRSPT